VTRSPAGPPRPAVFLDRDGTLCREVGYLRDPRDFAWIPGARRAVASLNRAGFAAVVITNQSGIARGFLDEDTLGRIHERMTSSLAESGAQLDGIYWCPHHPQVGEAPWRQECRCRKPAPGLLERAAAELDLDLEASWIVGDSSRDLEAGAALGLPGLLVATGKGVDQAAQLAREGRAVETVADVSEAVDRILSARSQGR
jgi:D-glycero-D-manno-heptose 1,7-bisphosphate phosphatase